MKDHKEAIDDFMCEMQSDLAKTYSKMLLTDGKMSFNPFLQMQLLKLN